MNLSKKIVKIGCSRYTDLDEKVIAKASSLGMPLIGGTALEVWASATKTPGVRKRSDNDLDFIATDAEKLEEFQSWVTKNIDPDKVQVDVYLEDKSKTSSFVRRVNGVLIMSLAYMLWSKLTRSDRSQKDLDDIKWILSVKSLSDEEINEALDVLGVTDEEFNTLMELATHA